jgi:hypothetical protein
MPLKLNDCLSSAKTTRTNLNPAMRNPKSVTGTDMDLRRLTKEVIRDKLINLKNTSQKAATALKDTCIEKLKRWDMITLYKDLLEQGCDEYERDTGDSVQERESMKN